MDEVADAKRATEAEQTPSQLPFTPLGPSRTYSFLAGGAGVGACKGVCSRAAAAVNSASLRPGLVVSRCGCSCLANSARCGRRWRRCDSEAE